MMQPPRVSPPLSNGSTISSQPGGATSVRGASSSRGILSGRLNKSQDRASSCRILQTVSFPRLSSRFSSRLSSLSTSSTSRRTSSRPISSSLSQSSTLLLTPPLTATTSMYRIGTLLSTPSSSISSSAIRRARHDALTAKLLHEWLQACTHAASRSLPALERHVFLANCLGLMRRSVPAHVPEGLLARVDGLTDSHVDAYVRLAADEFIQRCGLQEVAKLATTFAAGYEKRDALWVNSLENETTRATQALDKRLIGKGMRRLQRLLLPRRSGVGGGGSGVGGGGMESIEGYCPRLVEQLENLRVQSRARSAVAERLLHVHRGIWRLLQFPKCGFSAGELKRIGLRRAARVEKEMARGMMRNRRKQSGRNVRNWTDGSIGDGFGEIGMEEER